jgi:sugar lactone lactonase YvrE
MALGTIVGQGKYTYEVDKRWGRRPGGVEDLGVAQGLFGDSKDRIFVFQRSPVACILIFNQDGKLLDSWGEGKFRSPHGIWMNDRDELFITDTASHLVTKWTADGKLLRTWGEGDGVPGEWGKPFNRPTKAFEAADGEMYVTDGYGNKHVHRFDKDGNLIQTWGDKGEGPGQFVLPHDAWIDHHNHLLVCDRENRRVQHFTRDGKFVKEWSDLQNPMQIYVRDGVMYMAHAYAEISVRTPEGEKLSGWPYESDLTHDKEKSPHSIWVDSRGDIYVGEVVGAGGLQKFIRQ